MGVARRGPVPAMPKQFADLWQVLARHDRLAGRRVAQVVQAQPVKLRVGAYRPPARREAPIAPTFSVLRAQERIRVARVGQRGDERSRGPAERHGARANLRIF